MKSRLNYSAWKTNNQAILEDLSDKKVMISYSGGKDSSVVLYLIRKAAKEFGFSYEIVRVCARKVEEHSD